jgi:raffinose/stachyose/melibiose transport system substrate-binding protein
MKKLSTFKMICVLISVVCLFQFAGCGNSSTNDKVESDKEISIKFFSNLPDRNSGQGKLEQTLIDNYMNENPNVKITVEALQDEPYKQKFKAYVSSNQLPDVYMTWGQPSFFNPIMEGGYAAELNKDDYKDYGFFPGSLDGFSSNNKLYGLARNTDIMVLFYNKELFNKYNVKVPENFDDLIKASKTFRENGIAPCAINGKDKWTLCLAYEDLIIKESGDSKVLYDAVNQKLKFKDSDVLKKAAEDLKKLVEAGFFQDSFVAADYGAANNLFAQEKAAMYYMGSWEVGMKSNESFSESFRENLDVMQFPIISSGKGKKTDYVAWNGGGYAVAGNSEVKDEAIKLLNYMMMPENWAKNAWQMGLVIPAQKYDTFMTGEENELQKALTGILSDSTSFSGTPWNDSATPSFKTDCETLTQELCAGIKSSDEFLDELDNVASK